MTDAMYQLEASSKSFNTATGKLTTLNSMLKEDFSKGSSYFDSAVNKVCTDAYAGAAVGAAFGPIGLAISYSIATGVVEGKLIPNLFDHMENMVQAAQKNITEAKSRDWQYFIPDHNIGNYCECLGLLSQRSVRLPQETDHDPDRDVQRLHQAG
jgi:hypothetical protein